MGIFRVKNPRKGIKSTIWIYELLKKREKALQYRLQVILMAQLQKNWILVFLPRLCKAKEGPVV